MTPWPVNISWALLANRSSCFAGRELALAFAPLTAARRDALGDQFARVFGGQGTLETEDLHDMATKYGCDVVVVVPTGQNLGRRPVRNQPRLSSRRGARWAVANLREGKVNVTIVVHALAAVPEDSRIWFRIGINVGDIIVDGDDIYGDGVNVAARIEALADPGGVYISRSAADQVRDKVPIKIETRGEHTVKNIARPIEVFCIIGEGGDTVAAAMQKSANWHPACNGRATSRRSPFFPSST